MRTSGRPRLNGLKNVLQQEKSDCKESSVEPEPRTAFGPGPTQGRAWGRAQFQSQTKKNESRPPFFWQVQYLSKSNLMTEVSTREKIAIDEG
jgi:hypothetical protein